MENNCQIHLSKIYYHQKEVSRLINLIIEELLKRSISHDISKIENSVEFEGFSNLINMPAYGSKEYEKILKENEHVIKEHYLKNRHHPQHFKTGYTEMNIVDIIEMLCDWTASKNAYSKNVSTDENLEYNKKRFNMSDDIIKIFKNSIKELF